MPSPKYIKVAQRLRLLLDHMFGPVEGIEIVSTPVERGEWPVTEVQLHVWRRENDDDETGPLIVTKTRYHGRPNRQHATQAIVGDLSRQAANPGASVYIEPFSRSSEKRRQDRLKINEILGW